MRFIRLVRSDDKCWHHVNVEHIVDMYSTTKATGEKVTYVMLSTKAVWPFVESPETIMAMIMEAESI